VIRYEGPKGGPGMREMLAATSRLKGIPELSNTVALITDGRFSGGTAGPASATFPGSRVGRNHCPGEGRRYHRHRHSQQPTGIAGVG